MAQLKTSLEKYNQKRDFNETPEPAGKTVKPKGNLRFVVQRHQASTLHYDFRLEMESVLKSWAVPKGPSMNPEDKRLAMMVEDHPYSYRTFEGDIPEGNYGAGHVDIWDEGTYHSSETDNLKVEEETLLRGLENGSIKFILEGEKLKGEFTLIKMKGRQENAWLLVKKSDEFAMDEPYTAEDHLGKIKSAKPKKPGAKTIKPSAKKTTKISENKKAPHGGRTEKKIGNRLVAFSSLDKVYWPEEGITKGDLIDYYQAISDIILPYQKGRPQSLLRHPNGITKPGFFQKDIEQTPEWVKTVSIKAESTGHYVNYLVCENKATLAYMNNLGCIQLNPWNSRLANLNNPDYMVIDLDPGENTYDEVVETALVAKLIHKQLPELTSLERNPKERRKQIYLDFLQNAIGQTIASVYSVRPKEGAPVSTPLLWEEVKPGLHPSQFTLKNVPARIEKLGDIFKPVLGKGVDLEKCLKKLGG